MQVSINPDLELRFQTCVLDAMLALTKLVLVQLHQLNACFVMLAHTKLVLAC